MKGNFHVQFLGEGVAATPPPYPAEGPLRLYGLGNRVPQRAFERLELHEGKLCAAERGVESLTQSGGARRNASGSSG
jgi:hypothetical protein